MNNRKVIHALSNNLDRLKGFTTGYTTGNDDSLLISYDCKIYKITIEEVEEADEVTLKSIDKYL